MKKNSKILFFTAIITVILLYLVSAILTLGTIFTPVRALEIRSVNQNREQTHLNSFVTIDLIRSRADEENEGKTKTTNVCKIYVFVGEARSYAIDEQGNPYVEIYFHYKTTGDNSSSYYGKPIVAKIPVRHSSGGYEWIKVFDAQSEANGIAFNRFKISTPDSIDIHEVVFTDASGYVFPTDETFGTPEQIKSAKLLTDEQNTFKYSSSKKYHFTDAELKNLASVNALKGGKATIGDGPFSTVIYLVGTSIFGENTFGMRFFDFLSGVGMLLVACAFARKTFGKDSYGILTLLSVLAFGAVFTASNFALCSMGALFAVLSIYISSRYFVRHYYLEDKTEGVLCLLGLGLFYGLAVAFNPIYSLTLIGHAVLFAMARKRAYKQYKKDEKEAVGLAKEDVFLAYRKKSLTSLGVMAIALIVLPITIFGVSYLACAEVYKAYYGVGFVKGAIKCFLAGFVKSYKSNPFALLVGFGGIKLNSYYSFLNSFTCILALFCFMFVTFVVFFGKKIAFFSKVDTIKNKYKITTVAFLSLCLPVFFGFISSPYGFAGASVFMCAYIALAHSVLIKCFRKNVVDLAFSVVALIGLLIFGLAYVGYVGLAISETAKSVLYYWQVL